MIRVHVWFPNGGNVGHASASIGGGGSSAKYVSWWPTEHWKRQRPGQASTFDDDVRAEGNRRPDANRSLHGLDEGAAMRWWAALRARRGSYSAAKYNCAWAVISMLKAAGADERIPWTESLAKVNVPLAALTPAGLALCAGAAAGSLASESAEAMVATVDHCTSIWTPADVLRYAGAVR